MESFHRDPFVVLHLPRKATTVCEVIAPFYVEFLGTFFLVTSAGLSSSPFAAFAIGFTLVVAIFAGGHISGAHYNPAVTLAVWISRRKKITTWDALIYVLVQLVGGLVAALFCWLVKQDTFVVQPGPGIDVGRALLVEMVWTFLLATVVLQTATTSSQAGNSFFGLAIGFTVVAGILTVGPISGAAFNPAVATAATLVHTMHTADGAVLEYLWIYWLGPMLGGLFAGMTFWFTNRREYKVASEAEHLFSSDVKSIADVSAGQREGGRIIKGIIGYHHPDFSGLDQMSISVNNRDNEEHTRLPYVRWEDQETGS